MRAVNLLALRGDRVILDEHHLAVEHLQTIAVRHVEVGPRIVIGSIGSSLCSLRCLGNGERAFILRRHCLSHGFLNLRLICHHIDRRLRSLSLIHNRSLLPGLVGLDLRQTPVRNLGWNTHGMHG